MKSVFVVVVQKILLIFLFCVYSSLLGEQYFVARVVELWSDFLGMTTCERTPCPLYGVHGLSDDSNSVHGLLYRYRSSCAVLLNATIDFICGSGRFDTENNE